MIYFEFQGNIEFQDIQDFFKARGRKVTAEVLLRFPIILIFILCLFLFRHWTIALIIAILSEIAYEVFLRVRFVRLCKSFVETQYLAENERIYKDKIFVKMKTGEEKEFEKDWISRVIYSEGLIGFESSRGVFGIYTKRNLGKTADWEKFVVFINENYNEKTLPHWWQKN